LKSGKPEQAEPQKEAVKQELPAREPEKVALPASYLLDVPYTVQAPYANWNTHEESCEEAALLMLHYYLSGQQIDVIPAAKANQELIKMVGWQTKRYGKQSDLNLERLGQMAKDYYGYNYRVEKNITIETIKKSLYEGKPVLVPVITHGLQNPHYGPKPTYHILVIKGYDGNGVITNDAGVKEGRNYHYSWTVLWQAIDAQTAKMNQGRDMLTVTK